MPDMPVAMITGASRGIGRALAEDLVSRGWRVAALGRDVDLLAGLAAASPPDQVLPLVADVTDGTAMAQAVAALRAIWRTPDLVVANAGALTAIGPTWEADPDQWWHDMEVNVRGVFTTMRDVVPAMVQRGSGRVVVMSSGMGRFPSPWTSAYGASKAAASHLVSSVGAELAGTGVSVFAISPGMVHTDMTQLAGRAHRPPTRPRADAGVGVPARVGGRAARRRPGQRTVRRPERSIHPRARRPRGPARQGARPASTDPRPRMPLPEIVA